MPKWPMEPSGNRRTKTHPSMHRGLFRYRRQRHLLPTRPDRAFRRRCKRHRSRFRLRPRTQRHGTLRIQTLATRPASPPHPAGHRGQNRPPRPDPRQPSRPILPPRCTRLPHRRFAQRTPRQRCGDRSIRRTRPNGTARPVHQPMALRGAIREGPPPRGSTRTSPTLADHRPGRRIRRPILRRRPRSRVHPHILRPVPTVVSPGMPQKGSRRHPPSARESAVGRRSLHRR